MDLQEEYYTRKKVPAHLLRYVERGSVILRAKQGKKTEWDWLHVSIDLKVETNHPAHYQFVVAANPVIYASADFSHFSYHHSKVISETRWEWDQYEKGLMEWINTISQDYEAVPSSEALFVSWQMFLANYDSWLANFLPYRVIESLAGSLSAGDASKRLESIKEVEDWIREKYERVFSCWKNIRTQIDQKNYADWLATVMKDVSAKAA